MTIRELMEIGNCTREEAIRVLEEMEKIENEMDLEE